MVKVFGSLVNNITILSFANPGGEVPILGYRLPSILILMGLIFGKIARLTHLILFG